MNQPTIIVEIRGREFEVRVTNSGEFVAEYGDDTLREITLEKLKAALDRACKREKIAPIPFLFWTGEKMRSGKVHGIRANSSHLVVVYDDEKRPTQEWHLDGTVPPEFADDYQKLCDACVAATAARESFEELHGFNIREEIERRSKELEKGGGAS